MEAHKCSHAWPGCGDEAQYLELTSHCLSLHIYIFFLGSQVQTETHLSSKWLVRLTCICNPDVPYLLQTWTVGIVLPAIPRTVPITHPIPIHHSRVSLNQIDNTWERKGSRLGFHFLHSSFVRAHLVGLRPMDDL